MAKDPQTHRRELLAQAVVAVEGVIWSIVQHEDDDATPEDLHQMQHIRYLLRKELMR